MKNIQELRSELADNFQNLKAGKMEVGEVAEMNNTAGKIIKTLAIELKQAEITQTRQPIPFLRYDGRELPEGINHKQIS